MATPLPPPRLVLLVGRCSPRVVYDFIIADCCWLIDVCCLLDVLLLLLLLGDVA